MGLIKKKEWDYMQVELYNSPTFYQKCTKMHEEHQGDPKSLEWVDLLSIWNNMLIERLSI